MKNPSDYRFYNLLRKKLNEDNLTSIYRKLDPVLEIQNKLAETSSLQSALSELKIRVPELNSSWKMMSWYFSLCLIIPDCDYLKSEVLETLLHQAIQRYQPGNEYGIWIEFMWKFLDFSKKFSNTFDPGSSPYNPAEILEFLLEQRPEDEIFGNFSNMVKFWLRKNNIFIILQKRSKSRRPNYPQRKRGYNDKGSRRLEHISTKGKVSNREKEELASLKVIYREVIQTIETIEFNNWGIYPSRLTGGR